MKFNILKKKTKTVLKRFIYVPSKNQILSLIKSLHPVGVDKKLIRLGGESDGGYLVPNDLNGIKACFSPGVGEISNFEFDCAEKGMDVFMADGSVDNPGIEDERFNFIKKYIGSSTGEDYITLEEWVQNTKFQGREDLILQMDIEGYEFEVLNSTSAEILNRFRIIVVEFHNLHLLPERMFFRKAQKSFKKILKNHSCVHIHPNNCCGIKNVNGINYPVVAEFSFLRNDRIRNKEKVKSFPHVLDRDNTKNETIVLPEEWY